MSSCAPREVDTRGDDHHGHADSEDGNDSDLAGDIPEIVDSQENRPHVALRRYFHHRGTRYQVRINIHSLCPKRGLVLAEKGIKNWKIFQRDLFR